MANRIFTGLLLFQFLTTVSCFYNPPAFDKKAAFSVVSLSKEDLSNFLVLKQKLLHDAPAMKKLFPLQYDAKNGTLSTGPYFLNKIDSIGYLPILAKLEGKYCMDFEVNDTREVQFILKRPVDFKSDERNYVYEHTLVSSQWPLDTSKYSEDKIYKDSTISADWKYCLIVYRSGW